MSLADKMRARATQLADQAQQRIAQGQAKLTELQVRKQADALLRDLGAAVWAAQRQGGQHQPIEDAMAALDAHVAAHGPIDTAPSAPDEPPAVPDEPATVPDEPATVPDEPPTPPTP